MLQVLPFENGVAPIRYEDSPRDCVLIYPMGPDRALAISYFLNGRPHEKFETDLSELTAEVTDRMLVRARRKDPDRLRLLPD